MPFHVTLILADAAQAVGNKLYILGGGWSTAGPDPFPSAIALHIKVPWDEANVGHVMQLELVDSDGHPVTVQTDQGPQDLVIKNDFEVGRPPGMAPRYDSQSPALASCEQVLMSVSSRTLNSR